MMPEALQTVEAFYSYALAIEREAAERYREFESYFAARSEAVLAAICGMLARMEAEHYAALVRAADGLDLPEIRDVGFPANPGAPPAVSEEPRESAPRKDFYRITSSEQLLEIALEGEIRAQRFFAWAAATCADETVRALARGMAEEESRHIRWVSQALGYRNPLRA